ncbi:hypothetical protein CR513_28593, partial [Mucuna pruriens]
MAVYAAWKMESIGQDYDKIMEHASNRQLILPSSPDISNIVGAPKLNPRIGNEYQVEVPSMINESEQLQLLTNSAGSKLLHNEVEDNGHKGWRYVEDNGGAVNVTVPAAAANLKSNVMSDAGEELRQTTFQSVMTVGQLNKTKICLMAHDKLINSWSDADVKCFLLGLFIFGKNFVQIKRFLENKGMGEILSFYYGKFYKSDEYRRWSDWKKIKGRKCRTGYKPFSARKQRELLSRLILHISEELKDALQQVLTMLSLESSLSTVLLMNYNMYTFIVNGLLFPFSPHFAHVYNQVFKSYSEGKTSLEEYIFSLKSTVGLGVLVESVGIGKGKEDLTSPAVEPAKKTQVVSIPSSKAWSSLGPNDIIKHLTGGQRLSKAKSNDLFWEAVWPRLVARGWHSEKLENQGTVCSKITVVFLIPGITKFSKGKLVKGDNYFDSICDVLSKVIAEPNLLKLEVEETEIVHSNEEEAEKGSNDSDQSDSHHHYYLKNQASTNNVDLVDTGLVLRGKSSDSRELKSLPDNSVAKVEVDANDIASNKGNKHISKTNHMNGKLDDISPSETEAAMIYNSKKNSSNTDCQKGKHNRDATGQNEVNVNPDNHDVNKMAENRENQIFVSDGNQPKRTIKHQFSRRTRSDHSDLGVPPIKQRRLTACAKAETSHILENASGGFGSEKLGLSQSSCFPDADKKASNPLSHQQDVTLVSSEGSVELKNEGRNFSRVCLDKGISCDNAENCESQHSINFNAPQVPPESEEGKMMAMAEEDEQGIKPNDIIPRRKSTRNRPLTVRALESLANEFLHAQRKHKKKDTLALKETFSTCRRARTSHLKNVA